MILGIECLAQDESLRRSLGGRRAALLGHPASVDRKCLHSLDIVAALPGINLAAAFGPQHGMRGEKQDNMVESADYVDPKHKIPVFSLYGEVRRPTPSMLDAFDVLLVDLQDIGTRIYTYAATLVYMLEACAENGKAVWVLDRPNPAGRPVEGSILEAGWESFVGAAPLIMRHGLTLGEMALWYTACRKLALELRIVAMQGYDPQTPPGYGWPAGELVWVNPSPNASSLNMARCFSGTVLFEGTTLSEGRGTTAALEVAGAPDIDMPRILRRMETLHRPWLSGCLIRECYFEPTFHKHAGRMCSGVQIHTDNAAYDHRRFRPYRLCALLLKALRLEYPDYEIWRQFHYEYERDRLAIDLLSGGAFLRTWVDDPAAQVQDLEERLEADERRWAEERMAYLLYPRP